MNVPLPQATVEQYSSLDRVLTLDIPKTPHFLLPPKLMQDTPFCLHTANILLNSLLAMKLTSTNCTGTPQTSVFKCQKFAVATRIHVAPELVTSDSNLRRFPCHKSSHHTISAISATHLRNCLLSFGRHLLSFGYLRRHMCLQILQHMEVFERRKPWKFFRAVDFYHHLRNDSPMKLWDGYGV